MYPDNRYDMRDQSSVVYRHVRLVFSLSCYHGYLVMLVPHYPYIAEYTMALQRQTVAGLLGNAGD